MLQSNLSVLSTVDGTKQAQLNIALLRHDERLALHFSIYCHRHHINEQLKDILRSLSWDLYIIKVTQTSLSMAFFA